WFRCGIEFSACQTLACDQQGERKIWVIAGHSCRISTRPDWNTRFKHSPDGRRAPGLLFTITTKEVLSLESHAILYGDSASQRLYAFDVLVRDSLAAIENPVQALKRNFSISLYVT